MAIVHRLRGLVVVVIALVVLGVGLVELFSTENKIGQATTEGCSATTAPLRSADSTDPTPSPITLCNMAVLPLSPGSLE
jgi:hypothetical protein